MRPREFRFISLHDELLKKMVDEIDPNDCLLIFPTQASLDETRRLTQARWGLQNRLYLTMEQLQQQLHLPEAPLLREEKRTLAFYRSLSAENRAFFKISSYPGSIDLSLKFFSLWEEFRQEMVDEDRLERQLDSCGIEWLEWQASTFERLLSIRDDYHRFIAARGFSDLIFILNDDHLDLRGLDGYDRVVFVNQFYYTRLERHLIDRLSASGRQVIIYYQLPDAFVDRDRLAINPFNIGDLAPGRLKNLHTHICHNEFSEYSALIQVLQSSPLSRVVDVKLHRDAYVRFLSPERFEVPMSTPMADTTAYRFFAAVEELLQDLTFDPVRRTLLSPVVSLIRAISCREVVRHFLPDSEHSVDGFQARWLTMFYDLLDDHYQYIDLQLRMADKLKRIEPSLRDALRRFMFFLERTAALTTIHGLCEWVDDADGFQFNRILSPAEREYSDLADVFYRLLADFAMLEESGLVDDWAEYFPGGAPHACSRGILRLFLDYMKSSHVHYTSRQSAMQRTGLTTLMDTRNLAYERIAILNLSDGLLPSRQEMQYLLTERQRAALGLKTFEDVRIWEKYYFARLLFSSSDAHLFAIRNEEENVEISSFVEELIIALESDRLERHEVTDAGYRALYHGLLTKDGPGWTRYGAGKGWGRMPCDPQIDFEGGRCRLGPTTYSQLKTSPFEYCIRQIGRIKQRPARSAVVLDHALLGEFGHQMLNRIWERYLEDSLTIHPPLDQLYKNYGERVEAELLGRQSDFYWKLPQNHERIFFQKILLPRLQAGCVKFFDKLGLMMTGFKEPPAVFPEQNVRFDPDNSEKLLVATSASPLRLPITLYGRSDLRLVHSTPRQYYIIDYKTGRADRDQLLFYELYYYLLDEPTLTDSVHSFFYHLLDSKWEPSFDRRRGDKRAIIDALIDDVKQVWLTIVERGYAVAGDRANPSNSDLLRPDLLGL